MTQFSVLTGELSRAASQTHAAADDLTAELRVVRREVGDVVGGRWRGAAATAFDRAWIEWDTAATEVISALGELAELLAQSGHEYAWRDDTNSERLTHSALML